MANQQLLLFPRLLLQWHRQLLSLEWHQLDMERERHLLRHIQELLQPLRRHLDMVWQGWHLRLLRQAPVHPLARVLHRLVVFLRFRQGPDHNQACLQHQGLMALWRRRLPLAQLLRHLSQALR